MRAQGGAVHVVADFLHHSPVLVVEHVALADEESVES
jgi:hypothetical protein